MTSPVIHSFETSRPEEAAEAIHRSYGYGISLSAGDLSYRHHVAVGDVITASDLSLGASLKIKLDPTDEVMIVDVHDGTYSYDPWDTPHVIGAGGSFLMPPGQALNFAVDHVDASTSSFSVSALRRVAADVLGREDIELAEGTAVPGDRAKEWLWRKTAAAYRQRALNGPGNTAESLLTQEADRFLIVSALAAFSLAPEPTLQSSTPAAIRRATAFIDEHLQTPLTVADIAAAARLSPRGLLFAFRRELGQTPSEYVRAARLTGAHADLAAGDPTRGDTVSAIASAWGFTNSGRFTGHYRRIYGESPRDTLNR